MLRMFQTCDEVDRKIDEEEVNEKDRLESIKHWEEQLAHYKDIAKRGCNYTTDQLPLRLGWSYERSIEWIEEELRLLKNE